MSKETRINLRVSTADKVRWQKRAGLAQYIRGLIEADLKKVLEVPEKPVLTPSNPLIFAGKKL